MGTCDGSGVGTGVGTGDGSGVGTGDGSGVGMGVGTGDGCSSVGTGVGTGDGGGGGSGDGAGVGAGVGSGDAPNVGRGGANAAGTGGGSGGGMGVASADGVGAVALDEKDEGALVRRVLSLTHCPYACLGVPVHSSREACRKRFLQLALRLHPDKAQHPKARDAFTAAERAFRSIETQSGVRSSAAHTAPGPSPACDGAEGGFEMEDIV